VSDKQTPTAGITVVATAAMTVSMLQLFVLGALGPVLVRDLRIEQWQLGALVGAGFAIAAALSVPAGAIVDRIGPRRCLVGLFVMAALTMAVLASARSGWWMLAAVLVGGLPQALANPATNKLIMAGVPAARRGPVTGWKQSGVQWGAFLAGLPLSALASVASWRIGIAALAVLSVLAAVVSSRVARVPAAVGPGASTSVVLGSRVALLAVFSVALGAGLATVNTYLSLFAHTRLGFPDAVAGALVAMLGVAGIAGRVGWSRVAGRLADPVVMLPWLAVGAAVAASLVLLSGVIGSGLVWLGAAAVGMFGVSGNAVSMVAVMRAVPAVAAGRAAAVVSAGFFSGFAVGPPLGGALATRIGYGWVWGAVTAAFGIAAVIALVMVRNPVPDSDSVAA
jgi:predicted MFS family arabinose efflux permease